MNTMSLPVLSATGSLETYIQAVNRFPLLTQEQETEYARRLRSLGITFFRNFARSFSPPGASGSFP